MYEKSHVYSKLVCICMYGIETIIYMLFCAQRSHVGDTSWTSRTLGLLYGNPFQQVVFRCYNVAVNPEN